MFKMVATFYFIFYVFLFSFFGTNYSLSQPKGSGDNNDGLYTKDDKIEILNMNNFKRSVYYQKNAWVVEFYSSWCGFCQRFAPVWKQFAADINIWKHIVRIGAIDCANDANNNICRDFEIMSYPTLRFFHESYVEKNGNIGDILVKGVDVKESREVLVSKLQQEQESGRGVSWPSLQMHEFQNLADIWFRIPKDIKVTFLVFESSNSTIGSEVILDMDNVFGIRILRINPSSQVAKIADVSRYPSVVALKRDLSLIPLTPKVATRETLRKAILIYLQSNKFTILQSVLEMIGEESAISDASKHLSSTLKHSTTTVYQADLETALRYSLHHEITNQKLIADESLLALKNYVKILSKYFPFTANGQLFMNALLNLLDQRDNWNGKDLADSIEQLESDNSPVFSTLKEWVGCKGSMPHIRGFTCGLWMTFHTLSVNAAISNKDDYLTEGKVILGAIHGYVKHFFGCAECSEHFQAMAKRRKLFEVSTLEKAVLWLWMAHNEVNMRLAGDPTEDPVYPKKQFPTIDACPSCHYQNGDWNINATYNFMLNMYGAKQISLLDLNLSTGGNANVGSKSKGK